MGPEGAGLVNWRRGRASIWPAAVPPRESQLELPLELVPQVSQCRGCACPWLGAGGKSIWAACARWAPHTCCLTLLVELRE